MNATLIILLCLTFRFTRTDGTFWQFNGTPPGPETPALIGTNHLAVGSQTNYYNGSAYTIDPTHQTLIKDGIAKSLIWFAPDWKVQAHYGFAISDGVGYIITLDSDADNRTFFLRVDLRTAQVDYIDYLGNAEFAQVNGLQVVVPIPRKFPRASTTNW